MFTKYIRPALIPLLSMATGIGTCWFLVIWVQHECYDLYLRTASGFTPLP